ncbi:hypothetical protein CKQ84_01895 [Shewanella sp. WE21]|jgi:hypothetical protein|uniref:hypothetical protein n=1 Tax=Shewanella sp. WE21 TaxID=2029986 RepID=UPI000CF5E7D9|nr:hypothetical protein [Shewanella sp. WE21]AVI64732.1 hypothetical protein CKQ84_01895 [Shewanella sp. WE21]
MPNKRIINAGSDGFSSTEDIQEVLNSLREQIDELNLIDDSNIPDNIGVVNREMLEKANDSVLHYQDGKRLTVLSDMFKGIVKDPKLLEIHNSLLAAALLARACGLEGMYSYCYKQSFVLIEKILTERLASVQHSEKRTTPSRTKARALAKRLWKKSPHFTLKNVSELVAGQMNLAPVTINQYISDLNPRKGQRGRPKK